MAKPKVSILIPIFNVEKYLDECLTSVVRQTLRDIEIICINDGSTDSSLAIIQKYAKNDTRIKLIDKNNSGYGDSMNQGLAQATGEYIGIIESDDFADLDMFESLYQLARDNSAEVVKSNFYIHFSDLSNSSPQWSKKYGAIYSKEFRQIISKQDTLNKIVIPKYTNKIIDTRNIKDVYCKRPSIWSAIYSRDFLDTNDIKFLNSPGASYQDTGFSFKVWLNAKRVFFSEQAFLHYRQDNENSSIHNPGKTFCVNDEYSEVSNYITKHHLGSRALKMVNTVKYGTYLWNLDRLDVELKPKFMARFSAEFKQAIKDKLLKFDDFSVIDQFNIKEIAYRPKKFFERRILYSKTRLSVIFATDFRSNVGPGLETILGQASQECEIVCISYGSSEKPNPNVFNYYKKDPRIKIYLFENDDIASALNFGMARATSEYLIFGNPEYVYEGLSLKKLISTTSGGADILLPSNNPLRSRRQKDLNDKLINRTDKSIYNKLFRTDIQRYFDVWFPSNVILGNIKFVSDFMTVCKTVTYTKELSMHKPPLDILPSRTIAAIDYIAPLLASFQFLRRNNLTSKHREVFLHNLEFYYSKALILSPIADKSIITKIIKNFISDNEKYIDSLGNDFKAAILGATIDT